METELEKVSREINAKAKRRKKASCDQCVAVMINGVFCHEVGCPNVIKAQQPKAGQVR